MPTLLETVRKGGGFKTLVAAIEETGLIRLLNASEVYTLFAPTDNAFKRLTSDQLRELQRDPIRLAQILKYHLVVGKLPADRLRTMHSLRTEAGDALRVTHEGNDLFVNGTPIVAADVQATNGIIHAIDGVLLPAGEAALTR